MDKIPGMYISILRALTGSSSCTLHNLQAWIFNKIYIPLNPIVHRLLHHTPHCAEKIVFAH